MTTSARWLLLVLIASCSFFDHESARLGAAPDAPVAVRLGCALAEQRCTRCHTIDRILAARVDSPVHWQAYVHRMRLQPQSGILPDEERPILDCLVFRSFGPDGLASLGGPP
jgi:hypothetical protein